MQVEMLFTSFMEEAISTDTFFSIPEELQDVKAVIMQGRAVDAIQSLNASQTTHAATYTALAFAKKPNMEERLSKCNSGGN